MSSWIHEDINFKIAKHQQIIEISKAQLHRMNDLAQQNLELQSAASEAAHLRKIAQLESATNHPLPPSIPSPPTTSGLSASQLAAIAATTPPLNITSTEMSNSQSSNPHHTVPQANAAPDTTTPAPKTKTKRPILSFAQVSRFYSPPSKTQGYPFFLYFTARGRERIAEIRVGLTLIDISKNRIFDIHFSNNNIISFLVHNNYCIIMLPIMSLLSCLN